MSIAKRGIILVSLDLSNFFGSIEWGLVIGLALKLGMPETMTEAFLAFLSGLKRRFKVGDTFSNEWHTTLCGTPQGDALSILWANLASLILVKRLSNLRVWFGSKVYVDDRYLWVKSIAALKKTLASVKLFDDLACNRLNPKKTKVMATSLRKGVHKVSFDGHLLSTVSHLKGLGCTLSSVRRAFNDGGNARAATALATLKRARHTATVWSFRKRVISNKVRPQLAYGAALSSATKACIAKVRTAAVRLVWGRGRASRAPELVLQCLTDPAKSDPASAVAVETIVSVLRGVVGNPGRYQLLMDIAASKRVRPRALRSNHPTARFLAALKSLGADLSSEGVLSHPAFPNIALSKVNVKEAVPYLRDAVKYNLTKILALRSRKVNPRSGRTARSDFQDLPFAVDWESTLSLLREKRDSEKGTGVTEDQAKALTVILTGAQRSMERLFRHKQPIHPGLPAPASAVCPFCDMGVPEAPKHIFWECEAHSAAHVKCGTVQLLKDWNALAQGNDWMESFDFPDYLLCNGIVQEDPFLLPGPNPIVVDGRVCLATDGSTQNSSVRRLRYSGVGVTGSPGPSWTYHAPLGGPTQQNDKAELVAAVLTVEAVAHQASAFPGGVLLYIDNDWVCTNVARVSAGWRPPNSFAHIWWWRRLEVAISLLPPSAVATQWVPSHKDFTDVARGTLTADQLRLNSAADTLAEAGRNANAPNPVFQKAILARKDIIRKIQLTLIEVHLSRKALEASLIAAMLVTDSVIPLGLPPAQEARLLSVRDRVPSYCWASGSGVAVVPGLSARLFHADLPGDTRTGKAAVEAAK